MSQPVEMDLEDSVREILETMFFSEITGSESCEPGLSGIGMRVIFRGMAAGEMHLRLSEPAARELAANFLSKDIQEVSHEEISAVAGELSNMVCGCFLSRQGQDMSFELSTPSSLSGTETTLGGAGVTHQSYRLETGCLQLALQWNSSAA